MTVDLNASLTEQMNNLDRRWRGQTAEVFRLVTRDVRLRGELSRLQLRKAN